MALNYKFDFFPFAPISYADAIAADGHSGSAFVQNHIALLTQAYWLSKRITTTVNLSYNNNWILGGVHFNDTGTLTGTGSTILSPPPITPYYYVLYRPPFRRTAILGYEYSGTIFYYPGTFVPIRRDYIIINGPLPQAGTCAGSQTNYSGGTTPYSLIYDSVNVTWPVIDAIGATSVSGMAFRLSDKSWWTSLLSSLNDIGGGVSGSGLFNLTTGLGTPATSAVCNLRLMGTLIMSVPYNSGGIFGGTVDVSGTVDINIDQLWTP